MRNTALLCAASVLAVLATAQRPHAEPLLPLFASPIRPAPPAQPARLAPALQPRPLLLAAAGPGQQCRAAIAAAERAAGIPPHLMAAIARIESGRRDADGTVNPWPWSINAEGIDHVFDTGAEAIAAVRSLQARGTRSIDVGCMQVNLMYHPDAFGTLEQAFDPVANANYAARFLTQLHDQTGAWPTATAWYHSATPELGEDYRRKVMAVLPEEQRRPDPGPAGPSFGPGFGNAVNLASGWAAVHPDAPAPAGRGGVAGMMLARTAEPARIIPLAAGLAGRSLSAYRAMPIAVAGRPPARALSFGPQASPG